MSAPQRALLEKLGINVQRSSCGLVTTVHHAAESPGGSKYVDFVFAVRGWEGAPRIREPAKCCELLWADPRDLPRDVVDRVAAVLEAVRARQPLVFRGWD